MTSTKTAIQIGVTIGLCLSAGLFLTVPAYHNYIVTVWTNPWLLAFGVIGGFIAFVTDND